MNSLLGLITVIKKIALTHSQIAEEAEDTTNRQTALYSLKIMTRLLASRSVKPFLDVSVRALLF